MAGFLLISERGCYTVAQQGHDYATTYLFVKTLSAQHKHPILLNFKARTANYRKLCGISASKFNKLLQAAIRLKLAYYEGNNLRLRSHNADKKAFKHKNSVEVRVADAKPFLYHAIIKHNIKQQVRAIKFKASNVKKGNVSCEAVQYNQPYLKHKLNEQVTLSIRSAAKLFDRPLSTTYDILRSMKGYGLTLTQNRVNITKQVFRDCLQLNRPNIRFDKQTGVYYYVLAQQPHLVDFKSSVVAANKPKGVSYYDNQYW